jgi:hypothetical protein
MPSDRACSAVPGTSVFWDLGYETLLPDLDFLPAVLVLTRVISKPSSRILCWTSDTKPSRPKDRIRELSC